MRPLWILCSLVLLAEPLFAAVEVPALFTDHMVLQRNQQDKVWGWADAGEEITVTIGDQKHSATADAKGDWHVMLDPMPAGGPHMLTIQGSNTITIKDVLVGEVWVCSGQSNMQWPVSASNDPDLESLTANYPQIRLITVPQTGTQEAQRDFNGKWELCTPESVKGFSAVGYFFGRQLHQTLDVPVGLIDNAWGGSSVEAWIDRPRLEAEEKYKPLLDQWKQIEENYDVAAVKAKYDEQVRLWQKRVMAAKAAGKPNPPRPRAPRNPLVGQHRPANLYQGVLHPIIGYGIKGAIWYQGESNANRAYQYRDLFPLMIQAWREDWKQGDFPFYWVQLADFRAETDAPEESDWAELREAQTMTLNLPNTGQAVITDLGEADDIHPKDKQNVAKRLARIALARDYGYESLVYQSPQYESMQVNGNTAVLTFKNVGGGLDSFDTRKLQGFAIAGEDKQWHWADAKIVGRDKIAVTSPQVKTPVAVRYAWSDNPVANVQNRSGLPLIPFRTDDWDGITKGRMTR